MKSEFVLSLFIVIFSQTANAADWYVDGRNGTDNNAGTSKATAFRDIWRGIQVANPGDTIHVLPTVVYSSVYMEKSGTAQAPITLKGDGVAPNLTQIRTSTAFGIQVPAGMSYVTVQNFDVSALDSQWAAIFVSENSHHITISGNVVHDGSGGISTFQGDYLTISNNVVYNNAHYTANNVYGSGISVLASTDVDANTGIKVTINGNICYSNTNVPTPGNSGGLDSDGSGIILDDNRHVQAKDQANGHPASYRGKILVENNIMFGNGGRGVQIYQSDNAIVVNNTAFRNNQDPYESGYNPGEIEVNDGGNELIYNNILFSDGANDATANDTSGHHRGISVKYSRDGAGSIISNYNLIYNPQGSAEYMYFTQSDSNPVRFGRSDIFGNPLFANANVNPALANFHLQPASPAIGAGNAAMAPASDIMGVSRSVTGPVDMGAVSAK